MKSTFHKGGKQSNQHTGFKLRLSRPSTSWASMALLIALSVSRLLGHGSVGDPVSRVFRIFQEDPQSPDRPVSADAIAVAGTQPFYDWSEVNLQVPDYDTESLDAYRALIPDGTLAGAGRDKYAGLNLVRDDWPATSVNAGPYPVVFDAHVPHDPSFFRAFISKEGWSPNQTLGWDDLVELEGPELFIRDGSLYRFNVHLPQRTGHHVLYVIWQRVDPAGEVFFSLSDIDFGDGTGYGNPDNGSGTYDAFPDDYVDDDINASVQLNIQNDWGSGFTGEFTIQNNGETAINGWTLEFDMDRDISNWWNTQLVRREGVRYTVTHQAHNQFIAAGGFITFGFQASPGGFSPEHLGPVQLNGITLGNGDNSPPTDPDPTPVVPTLSMSNISMQEGNSGWTEHCLTLTLSESTTEMVHVTVQSNDGTAVVNQDYMPVGSMVHFQAGATEASLCIQTNGDTDFEADETFELILSGVEGAVLNQDRVTITLINDDIADEPEPAPEPTSNFAWVIDDNWGSGYVATATIFNHTDATITNWTLSFDLEVSIVNYWNAANATHNGHTHTFHNASWNGTIQPGGQVSFGLQASSSADLEPSHIMFNGIPLSDNENNPIPDPDPDPEPEPTPDPDPVSDGPLEVFVVNAWGSGLTAEASLPVDTSLNDWQLAFDFPFTITDIWNAQIVEQANGRVVVKDVGYNATVQSGGEILFGFNATGSGASTGQLIYPTNVELSSSSPPDESPEDTEGGIEEPEPAIPGDGKEQTGSFNYAETMQKSLYFYDAQRSGDLPEDFRVDWRSDSALLDGSDVGLDLTGGFYDAGDHVKFGLPGAFSFTMLGWSAVDQHNAWVEIGQLDELLSILRWETDYLLKAHVRDQSGETLELYGQVGNGGADHGFWGPPERMSMPRPAYKVTRAQPGSDLAGESAATLAVASMAFTHSDPTYAGILLDHAEALYRFADTYRGFYMNGINDAYGYYPSSHYHDELVWGALWLYRATGDQAYLDKAESYFSAQLESGFQSEQPSAGYPWTLVWDDKKYGAVVLLAALTGKEKYKTYTEKWLDYWSVGYNGQRIPYSPGGQAHLNEWGSLRYSANTAFLALWYADQVRDQDNRYLNLGISQINYLLGDNPVGRSYVVGFGNNPPVNPHHRAAHGSVMNDIYNPIETQHTLYGALVGGPGQADDVSYEDRRDDFRSNEVALDYNAGYTAALSMLYERFGGRSIANFPF